MYPVWTRERTGAQPARKQRQDNAQGDDKQRRNFSEMEGRLLENEVTQGHWKLGLIRGNLLDPFFLSGFVTMRL